MALRTCRAELSGLGFTQRQVILLCFLMMGKQPQHTGAPGPDKKLSSTTALPGQEVACADAQATKAQGTLCTA